MAEGSADSTVTTVETNPDIPEAVDTLVEISLKFKDTFPDFYLIQ